MLPFALALTRLHAFPGPARLRAVGELAGRSLFVLGDIAGFFHNLYGQLTLFALAFATFFFAWAAILYTASGSGNERAKQHAQSALYAALVGLALALLAGTVAGIISGSAKGQ